jgi:amidase
MAAAVRAGTVSALELADAHLGRIESLNGELNAFVALDAERARAQARRVDLDRARGRPLPLLAGVPFSVKDAFEVTGLVSRKASLAHPPRRATQDAPAVTRLRAAGAVLLGKTNMSELGLFPDAANRIHGATRNPHDPARSPGGSSGGEAAAIAARLSPLGLGGDYGGSIRCPAHFCGVAGLRGGQGAIPGDGGPASPLAPARAALSTCGPLARSVGDLELALSALTGRAVTGTRPNAVVVPPDATDRSLSDPCRVAVERAAEAFAGQGVSLITADPPGRAEAQARFDAVTAAETHALVRELVTAGPDIVSPQVWAIWTSLETDPPLPVDTDGQLAALATLAGEADAWLAGRGPVLLPAASTTAFESGRLDGVFDRFEHCKLASALGLPAVVVPVTCDSGGLPAGVQLVGRRGGEASLLAAAGLLEAALAG